MTPTHHLFIGTYTRDGSKGIYAMSLDGGTGELSAPQIAAECKNPSYLALSPDGKHLYAVSESEEMAAAFDVAPNRMRLTALQTAQPAGGKAPCHLVVDHTDRALLVANYHTGVVASLPLAADGKIGSAASVIQHTGRSVHPDRQTAPHVHSVTLSPDNRFVLVCDLGLDRIFTYQLDQARAQLSPANPAFTATAPGAGPRHLAFSRDGKFVFCINELSGTLTSYRYDPANGGLTEVMTRSTLPADFRGENTCAAVKVHPNGRFVYGSNRGHDSVAVFALDEASGGLTLVEITPVGGKGPRDFSLSPDGHWLVAANQSSSSLTVFKVDPETGRLRPTPHAAAISTPVCVLFAD